MNDKLKKIFLLIGGILLMAILVALAIVFSKDYPLKRDDLIYTISTIQFPSNIKNIKDPIYSPTNKIIMSYRDSNTDSYHIGVVDDDGNNLHNIYNGELPQAKGSNGARIMPYADNKRLLIGDYVIETEPNLDDCDITKTKALPIKYPDEITSDKIFVLRWTEIIIAPDNLHIGWTSIAYLNGLTTSINFIGRLEKNSTLDGYEINNATIISDISFVHEVEGKPGILKSIDYIHGGEIKQFTGGGTKITLAGAVKQGMSRSIVQDLLSNDTYALSHEAGYEETTIISPDGQLGLTMSTRFSPKTNCAILGLLPRPDSVFTLMGMNRYAYEYSITKVRTNRVGNIGPVLIINERVPEIDYHGYDLHDDSDNQAWVFRSPLSWHQSSAAAIWPERHRVTNEDRIRKITIKKDSKSLWSPKKPEKIVSTPDVMPYSLPLSYLKNPPSLFFNGTFEGVKGVMHCDRQANYITTIYDYYSIDGKVFTNGFEKFNYDQESGKASYEAKVTLSGEDSGSMDFKIVFSRDNILLKNESYGFATYHGTIIRVDDMSK